MTAPLLHKLADLLELTVIETPSWVQLEAVAAHEAGHAVIAIALGVAVQDVSVTRRSGGMTMLLSNPRGRTDVVASLAGPVAESMLLASMGIFQSALVVGCETDLRDAWASTPGSGAEHVVAFVELYAATATLVAKHWPAIMEVAAQLMVKRYVPADEVYEVCEVAGRGAFNMGYANNAQY